MRAVAEDETDVQRIRRGLPYRPTYRSELSKGERTMAKSAEGSTIVDTSLGKVEYVDHGDGPPVATRAR